MIRLAAGLFPALLLLGGYSSAGACESVQTASAALSAPKVARIGGATRRVLDIAVGNSIWIGTSGGGVFRLRPDGLLKHLDFGERLPSAVVRQVQPINDDKVWAGTDDGLVLIDLASPGYRCMEPVGKPMLGPRRADLVRVAPDDGSLLLQLRDMSGIDRWYLSGANVGLQAAQSNDWPGGMATATALSADGQCLDVAGVMAESRGATPWTVRRCVNSLAGSQWKEASRLDGMMSVAAVARNPDNGRSVLMMVKQQGQNVQTRDYALMEVGAQNKLVAHCSQSSFRNEVTGMVTGSGGLAGRLIVAVRGEGLKSISCQPAPHPPLSADPRLKDATALAIQPNGRLLVGTDSGLLALDPGATEPVELIPRLSDFIPPDAQPTDIAADGRSVLLSSQTEGVLQLTLASDVWQVNARWRPGSELPSGVVTSAVYGKAGEVFAMVHSVGIVSIHPNAQTLVHAVAPGAPQLLVQMAVNAAGLWVGTGATPENPDGGGVQLFPASAELEAVSVALPDRLLQPGGSILARDAKTIWVATRSGVLQVDSGGALQRLSDQRVQTVFRNVRTQSIAVVGATVQRWTDADGFVPVLFRISPSPGSEVSSIGHPVDVVVDNQGRWTILYSSGRIVLLNAQRQFEALLGSAQGVPRTSRKLLHLFDTDEIMVGTAGEGVHLLKR